MKRLIPLFLLALLFCSCQNEIKNWLAMSVSIDDNTKYISSPEPYMKTIVNSELTINLFLLPESDDFIEITKVYSSAPEVLLIESVDLNTRIIKAKTLKTGEAKIYVNTKRHGSTSTLQILVT